MCAALAEPPSFETVRVRLDDLSTAIVNRINKEQLEWLKSRHPVLPVLLKLTVRKATKTFHAILKFTYHKVSGERPEPELAVAIAPLARTFLDALITVIFVCDDLPARGRFYVASGWRQATDFHTRLHDRYGSDPEHAEWFQNHQAWIDTHEPDIQLTDEERADSRVLWWPTPGQMRAKIRSKDASEFLLFADEWFYRYLSQDAHYTYMGLARAGYLVGDPPLEQREAMRAQAFNTALAVYLALLSEIIAEAKLPNEARSVEGVWQHFQAIRPVDDLWNRRFQKRLAET